MASSISESGTVIDLMASIKFYFCAASSIPDGFSEPVVSSGTSSGVLSDVFRADRAVIEGIVKLKISLV